MCHKECADNSIAVYDIPKCAGLCDPVAGFKAASTNPLCVDSFMQRGSGDNGITSSLPRLPQDWGGVMVTDEHSVADLVQNQNNHRRRRSM